MDESKLILIVNMDKQQPSHCFFPNTQSHTNTCQIALERSLNSNRGQYKNCESVVESLVDQATLFSNSSGCKSMVGSIKFRGKVSGSLAWPSAVFFCDVLEMQCTSVWKRLLIYGMALWDMYATCHLCWAGSTMFDNRKLSNKRNHQDEAFWTGKKM